MAETTVPAALVEKMKISGGITKELDKIQSFGIVIEYDGRSKVKLSEGYGDLHEIAIETLERKYGENPEEDDDNEFIESLGDKRIEWKIQGETSVKFVKLFKKNIDELRKLKSIKYKVTDDKKKLPKCVDISCEKKDFEKSNHILKRIKEAIENVELHIETVERKDENKATKFYENQKFVDAFCIFEKADMELKIYGIKEKDSAKVLEEWMKLVKPQSQTPSEKSQSTGTKQDKTSNGSSEPVGNKSLHQKSSTSTTQTRAESTSPVPGETAGEQASGASSRKRQEKGESVTNVLPSTSGLENSFVRSNHNSSNGATNQDTFDKDASHDASFKASVSQTSTGQTFKDSSNSSKDKTIGSASGGATASVPNRQPGKKTSDGKYEFVMGKIKVFVYNKSVTELKGMDAIVNAANERMMHGGGVAYYIAKAAGKKMDNECQDYIKKHGNVRVTENFVSTAGDMKCKGIIHAVGPQWHEYRGRREECARDVYQTVLNCLKSTEQKKWKKMALIAISSAIFGVPKQLCAEMYIKAMADCSMNDPGSIQEIHFVDINPEILDLVEKAHKTWVDNPESLLFKNALKYEEPASISMRRTMYRKDPKPEPSILPLQLVQRKSDSVHYKVYGMLDLKVCTGSVLEVRDVDAVVCSMDTNYSGGLLNQICKAAGKKFEKELRESQRQFGELGDRQVFLLSGGNLKVKHVMAITLHYYIKDTTGRDLQRLHDIYAHIFRTANEEKFGRVVLPMVGIGEVWDSRSCCKQLLRTLLNLAKDLYVARQKPNIKELHLLNADHKYTTYLSEILHEMEQGTGHSDPLFSDNRQGNIVDGARQQYFREDYRWIVPSLSDGWTLHKPAGDSVDSAAVKGKSMVKTMKSTVTSKSSKPVFKLTNADCHYFKQCKKKAEKEMECGHAFCKACLKLMKQGCKVCLAAETKSLDKSVKKDAGNKCPCCLDSFPASNWEELKCGHGLCKTCLKEVLRTSPKCPTCNDIFGTIFGNQPDGQMHYRKIHTALPGYPDVGAINILYSFKDGTQQDNHPNPGQRYRGTQRQAYLPNNAEGKKVLRLLQTAFDRRLMFTIGESRTSGKGNRVTFNDIHIKTRIDGGPEKYGYPDKEYLTRVQEELRAKGVTE